MMQIMKDIGGVELPEYIARLTPEFRGDRNPAGPAAPPASTHGEDAQVTRPAITPPHV
jgi:hypothetical protein